MNPRWISMFYGAFDADTCVAEIRAPVGSSVVIGRFHIIRPLRLLDLHAFKELFVERASFFDPDFRRLREKARFLGHLVTIMSRPVMPSDEDFQYLPTQAVAEYLSEKIEPKLDGLIFPSSQRGGEGENVVLFRRAAGARADGTQNLESEVSFGWATEDDEDRDITVWTKPKRKKPASLGAEFEPSEPEHLSSEESALRIDLETLEIRDVKGVTYSTETRRVRRYKEHKGKLPF
jgi:RES domain